MLSYCQFRNKKKGESSYFVTPIMYRALTFNVIDANGTVGERLLRNVHVSFTRDTIYFMSLVMRKPVFGVSDKVHYKPDCTATEDGQRLEISDLGSRGIVSV